jgi:hypothetical protein
MNGSPSQMGPSTSSSRTTPCTIFRIGPPSCASGRACFGPKVRVLFTEGTVTSALQGLIGTTIGIVLGGALVFAIGSDEILFWIVFPPAILVAAYAPRAISFAAGQAGFTVAILILFNLIEPTGWEVGLVRVEDVAIGVAISVVVGLLFWPRGTACSTTAPRTGSPSRAGGRWRESACSKPPSASSSPSARLQRSAPTMSRRSSRARRACE